MAKRTTKWAIQYLMNWFARDTTGNGKPDSLAICNATGGNIIGSQNRPLECVLGGNAYVADNIVIMRAPYAMTVAKVRIGAGKVAPTDANLIGDVHYHATNPTSMTTIFTTQGNRPEIIATEFTADSGVPDVTSLAAGGWIGFCIDQKGSTLPGENITFEILE